MSDRIEIKVILKSNVVNESISIKWFLSLLFFNAEKMSCKKLTKGKFVKADINKLQSEMKNELNDDISSIIIKDSKNSVSLNKGSINKNITSLSCVLDREIFDQNRWAIIELVNNLMKNHGVVAYMCSLEDSFWQDNEQVEMYTLMGRGLDGVKTKKKEGNELEEIIDIEFNPGHSHRPNGIWFGSCWMMWYGENYFKYIPKQILLNFKDCYENKEISENCIRITLYESPWEYEKEENRDRQWRFRKNVGIDEIASILEESDGLSDDIDATIEISEGEFEHGGIRLFKYYYDSEDNLIEKSKAFKSIVYELDKHGKIVWSNLEKLK